MALDASAITKWSGRHLQLLQDAHVFKLGTNQNYEGDIKYANAVKIFTPPEVTTSSYARDGTITYTRPTPGEQVLVIDQRQSWGIKIDSLEKQLTMSSLWEDTIKRGAWQLADDVDDFIRDAMDAATPSASTLTARTIGLGLGLANAYELLVDLDKVLDKNNVPRDGRHAFINPDFEGFLTKDPRFSSFNTAEARKTIKGTPIGMVANLDVHVSNNLVVSGSTYTIQVAWKGAMTYAEQLSELRHITQTAGDYDERVDAELVFGGKVLQPQGLANCNVQFAA